MKARFTFVVSAALTLVCATSARAQDGFDVHTFDVVPSVSTGYVTLQQARVLSAGQYEVGLFFDYANDPLVFSDPDGDRTDKIVANALVGHVLGAVGIGDRLELGLDIPLVLLQDSDVSTPELFDGEAGVGLGDVRFVPEVLFFGPDQGEKGPALSLAIDTWLPTGDEDALQGGGFRIRPRLAFDFVFGSTVRLGINAGYFVRPAAQFGNLEIDDAVSYGTAVDVTLGAEDQWHIVPEIRGETTVGIDDFDTEETPLEGLLAFKYIAAQRVAVTFGGGTGLINGAGVPDFRAFAGVTVFRPEQRRSRVHLPDDVFPDLVVGRDDCPDEEEDEDGFQDDDGCPDPDNDQDYVLDELDACPDNPEDIDGYLDSDGCPDPDNDFDGILDEEDFCPDEAEDFDGLADADGCPEDDADSDGIADDADICPMTAEDIDGEEDDDGCPDVAAVVGCYLIEFTGRVEFDTGNATLLPESYGVLDQVVRALEANPNITLVEIGGHTDDVGEWEDNQQLSQDRADEVMNFLIEVGIDAARLTAYGYGEDIPIDTNEDEVGRSNNRRVEFVILERTDECVE